MAIVFHARDLRHGREVATKVLHPEVAASIGPERFLREIRTTASLQHPHILPLHDSGEADGLLYYVMPYVADDSLASVLARTGALRPAQAVAIAVEIADALAHSHSLGIVHRDIKPGNVLMAGGGHVCVADFGLARLVEESTSSRRLTRTGIMVGSPLYMSPEQATGVAQVTDRADVYALGCVLFEMLAGAPPFTGDTAQSVLAQHAVGRPPSVRALNPAVPASLERVILQALKKEPRSRPSASAFREMLISVEERPLASRRGVSRWFARIPGIGRLLDRTPLWQDAPGASTLRWLSVDRRWLPAALIVGAVALLGTGAVVTFGGEEMEQDTVALEEPMVPVDRSIAVLPFEDLSGDSTNRYFSHGITEDILTNIGKLGTVNVISRSSTARYQATDKSLSEIGRELGVSQVLVGTVRRDGTRVRINARLVKTDNEHILWSERYDEDAEDIFAIQSRIAEQILTALRTELTPEQRLRVGESPTDNLSAYDLFLKGREHLNGFRAPRDARTAIELFRQALTLDTAYAPAHAGLGRAYQILYQYTGTIGLDSAIHHSQRAIGIGPGLADGYSALGRTYSSAMRFGAALTQLRHALELNPNDAEAVTEVAEVYTLLGRYDAALPWARRAVSLQPTSGRGYANVGELYFDLGDLDTAERWLTEALRLEPDELWANALMVHLHSVRRDRRAAARFLETILEAAPNGAWGYVQAGLFAVQQGDHAAAIRHYERAAELSPSAEAPPLELGFAYSVTGASEEAREVFDRNERAARAQLRGGDAGPFPYVQLARIYAGRGDVDQAVGWMRTAYGKGARDLYFYLRDPLLRRAHGDPRYQAILSDIRADVARMRQRASGSG